MKAYFVLACFLGSALAASFDLDPEDNLNEEEFEEYFILEHVDDPVEELKREDALVENENIIKETKHAAPVGAQCWDGTGTPKACASPASCQPISGLSFYCLLWDLLDLK